VRAVDHEVLSHSTRGLFLFDGKGSLVRRQYIRSVLTTGRGSRPTEEISFAYEKIEITYAKGKTRVTG
jgi:hypothetical protein